MTLRSRLSLMLAVLFTIIFSGTNVLIIFNARNSVEQEQVAASKTVLELIDIAIGDSSLGHAELGLESVISKIMRIDSSRHVHIDILPKTHLSKPIPTKPLKKISSDAPQWFIEWVKPKSHDYRRVVLLPDEQIFEIIVRSNPSNEISEVWSETRLIVLMLMILFFIAILTVYFTLGRGLAPIEKVLHGLDEIEQGNYSQRLPEFNTPEMLRISSRFNSMAKKLETIQRENTILTQQSLNIQEQERRNLAIELHDHLGQSITAIKAVAASIPISDKEPFVQKSVRTILEISNTMYDSAHVMIRRLRPLMLDELGLVKTLQNMIDDWNSHHEELFCHFSFTGDFKDIGEKAKISLYRIVQESLTNVVKHAKALNVYIALEQTLLNHVPVVELTINDDGIGLDAFDTNNTGLGIRGMKERVHALGGKFKLSSLNGTEIQIQIPISDETQGNNSD